MAVPPGDAHRPPPRPPRRRFGTCDRTGRRGDRLTEPLPPPRPTSGLGRGGSRPRDDRGRTRRSRPRDRRRHRPSRRIGFRHHALPTGSGPVRRPRVLGGRRRVGEGRDRWRGGQSEGTPPHVDPAASPGARGHGLARRTAAARHRLVRERRPRRSDARRRRGLADRRLRPDVDERGVRAPPRRTRRADPPVRTLRRRPAGRSGDAAVSRGRRGRSGALHRAGTRERAVPGRRPHHRVGARGADRRRRRPPGRGRRVRPGRGRSVRRVSERRVGRGRARGAAAGGPGRGMCATRARGPAEPGGRRPGGGVELDHDALGRPTLDRRRHPRRRDLRLGRGARPAARVGW